MKTLLAIASTLALTVATHASPADDAKAKATTVCAACHGPDGNSFNGAWPKLAGQHASYITAQLQFLRCQATKGVDCPLKMRRYEDLSRVPPNGSLMMAQAGALSDADIAGLAEYFSKQTLKPGVADAALVAKGQALYRGGNKESGTAACTACHGPDGRGNAAARFPAIGGQHAPYLEEQLKAFRDGSRRGDANQIMRNVASNLTDDEIRAVASYLQGLH